MSTFDESVTQIRTLTEHDNKTITQKALKLSEEVGEVANAVLSETNAPGCEYKQPGRDEVIEELCDVFIVLVSLLEEYSATDEEVLQTIDLKLSKWSRVIGHTT